MGWSKYKEDNRIINEERDFFKPDETKTVKHYKQAFPCPYCNKVFEEKNLLYSHIKKEHNIVHPLLMIDGKIRTNDNDLFISSLSNAIIYLYGYDKDIYVDDIKVELKEEIDITKEILDCLKNSNVCSIKFADKCINVHKYTIQEIHNDEVLKIIENWNEEVSKGKRIKRIITNKLNQAEMRYIDGFYNYFLACEAEGTDKINRYDDAYYLLSSFSKLTSIGNCVLKVISFRRNWVDRLDQICKESDSIDDFTMINDFFKNDIKEYPKNDELSGKLYIEDELQNNIDAILKFVNKDYVGARRYTIENDPVLIQDTNLKDRVLLLKARIEVINNPTNPRVRKFYKEMQTQAFIEEEKKMVK